MRFALLLGVLALSGLAGGLWLTNAAGAPAPPQPTINPPLPPTNTTTRSATLNYSEAYGSNLSFAAQAMQGDAKYSPGDWLNVGFQVNMPGQHPAATITLDNSRFAFAVTCWDGSTPTQSSYTVTAPSTSIVVPANDGNNYPTSSGAAAASYQGSVQLPSNLCGLSTGNIRFKSGATYTALLSSTDTTDKVQVQWHYVDANTAKKGSNINCSSTAANPNPGNALCNGGWSGTVSQVAGTAQSSISFVCKLDSASSFTACGSGSASGSISYGPPSGPDLAVGLHTFQVEAVVASVASAPASYSWTIVKNQPTLSVSGPGPSPTTPAGTSVPTSAITAALGGGYSPTGSIAFTVYGPSAAATCSGSSTSLGSATVSGNGGYHPASPFTPDTVGNYWLYASYGGDTNNFTATSTCSQAAAQEITVSKANTALSAAAPANGTAGTTILASAFSAGLSSTSGSNAGGTISFTLYGPSASATCTGASAALGSASVHGNGSYSPTSLGDYTPHVAGTYWLYASYGGDGNNNPANSPCMTGTSQRLVVAPASPQLSVSAPSNLAAGGTIATGDLTATVSLSSGSNATSPITFRYFGPSATAPASCTSGGTVFGTKAPAGDGSYHPSSGSFTPDTAGTYWWYVSSPADANNNAAASTCNSASMTKTVVANPTGPLTISGNVTGLLYPGGATRSIPVKLVNPNSVAVGVTTLNVAISAGTFPVGCVIGDFVVTQSNAGSSNVLTVPANGSVTLPSGGVSAPTIRMKDNGNQDSCKNATFTLTYTSS